MLYPPIDELRTKADNKYTLVSLAAKRARDIIDGYPILAEEVKVNKPVSIATEEIAKGEITYSRSEELEIMKRTGVYPKKAADEADEAGMSDEADDSDVQMTITFASEDGKEQEESFNIEFESEESQNALETGAADDASDAAYEAAADETTAETVEAADEAAGEAVDAADEADDEVSDDAAADEAADEAQ